MQQNKERKYSDDFWDPDHPNLLFSSENTKLRTTHMVKTTHISANWMITSWNIYGDVAHGALLEESSKVPRHIWPQFILSWRITAPTKKSQGCKRLEHKANCLLLLFLPVFKKSSPGLVEEWLISLWKECQNQLYKDFFSCILNSWGPYSHLM